MRPVKPKKCAKCGSPYWEKESRPLRRLTGAEREQIIRMVAKGKNYAEVALEVLGDRKRNGTVRAAFLREFKVKETVHG
jgi:hypothetical protein